MITIIAGINGAGKSSIAGEKMRREGSNYFNPDEVARGLMDRDASLTPHEANARAWMMGYKELSRAIEDGANFTLETTLGGTSICEKLHEAMKRGQKVRIFYIGLDSPELHIERVAARVAKGGHDIPEDRIRQYWKKSIHNMLSLIPHCAEVQVFDNSAPASERGKPQPVRLFSLVGDELAFPLVDPMPEWAKLLADAVMQRVHG